MFRKIKKKIIDMVILALLLLTSKICATSQQGTIPISKEKALEARMEKGECLIPSNKWSCCAAVIVSYLINIKNEDDFKLHLTALKGEHKDNLRIIRWFNNIVKRDINIKWTDVKNYYQKDRNGEYYFDFLKKQEVVFSNFCHNVGTTKENFHSDLQKVANCLGVNIVTYKIAPPPDIRKVKFDLTYYSLNDSKTSKIRILIGASPSKQEITDSNGRYYTPHYRALLNDPTKWIFPPLPRRVNQQPQNNLPTEPEYNIEEVKNKFKLEEERQEKEFKKALQDLYSMIKRAEKEIFKNIEVYNTEELRGCMNLYEKIQSSDLVNRVREYINEPLATLQHIREKIDEAIEKIAEEASRLDFSNLIYQKKAKSEKEKYFLDLVKKFKFLLFIEEKKYSDKIISGSIKEGMIYRIHDAKKRADKILEKNSFEQKNCSKLNYYLQTFELFSKFEHVGIFGETHRVSEGYTTEIIDKLIEIVEKITQKALSHLTNQTILVECLVDLETIEKYLDKVYTDKLDLKESINTILNEFKKHYGDNSTIRLNELSAALRRNAIGAQLVAENEIFRGIAIMLRNTAFDSIRIGDILRKIEEYEASYLQGIVKSKINKNVLNKIENTYQRFTEEYWQLVNDNLGQENATDIVIANIKRYIADKQIPGKIEWVRSTRVKIPSILAHIFAYWTLRNAQYYNQTQGIRESERKKYLLQPHAAQVVAVFRILGIGEGILNNHLIQVGTGEGKSVIAFATATTLALLGFDVSCVCYSEYLSERDQKAFMPLIREIGMGDYVHYTTFNQLCEDMINQQGSVRDKIVEFIKKSSGLSLDGSSDVVTYMDDDKKDDDSDTDSDTDNDAEMNAFMNTINVTQTLKPKTDRARIIFIDEVDVFFNKDFYGSPYSPTALLQNSTVTKVIQFVWENRRSVTFHQVKNSNVYKDCIKVFKKWESIIEESVKSMVADVRHFDSPAYVIHNRQLCYKEGDSINSKITYKYKTTFACLKEQENQTITEENLQEHLGLYLNAGIFSYAEVPHQFDHILGVTGTLDKLSPVELEIIERKYKIKKHTYMPSLYGDSKRKFYKNSSKGIEIRNNSYYANYLKMKIIESLKGIKLSKQKRMIKKEKLIINNDNLPNFSDDDDDDDDDNDDSFFNNDESRMTQNLSNKRAVIVFFETSQELDTFFSSKAVNDIRGSINIMKSNLSYEEKDRRISQAVIAGSITFSIREFGRGTDFVCYDPVVNSFGGVHVIITFFPENISEETQIIGRTARQRNEGSVSMILKEESIEHLITPEEIANYRDRSDGLYKLLNERRKKVFDTVYRESIRCVGELGKRHKEATLFVKNLWLENITKVTKHLLSYNAAPEDASTRTAVLVDSTASMGNLLLKAVNNIGTMFKRINDILEKKKKANAFSLQFVAYRNYNAPPNMLLEVSPWESSAQNLIQFMQNVRPSYGWSNEAIEIGLAHVVKEHEKEPIDQVILIGDMPPNTKDDVFYKRKQSTIEWEKEPLYNQPTYYEDEVNKIKNLGIPIHTFPVPCPANNLYYDNTKKIFNQIASDTKGEFQLLDIHSQKGAEQLMHIVSIRVLAKTGGTEAVKSYVEKFGGKSFMGKINQSSKLSTSI